MTVALGDVVDMPDGTWRVAKICDEPDSGLIWLEPIEPPRGTKLRVPALGVEVLQPTPPLECPRCGAYERDVFCSKCGEER